MRHFRNPAVFLLMLAGLAACAEEPKKCTLYVSGTMPVLNTVGSPIVRAAINGHPVALGVDTGAFNSIIGEQYAIPLGTEGTANSVLVHGVGGDTFAQVVVVDKLDMGTSSASNIMMIAGGKFPGHIGDLPIVGLFGRDFLRNYDTIVDMPSHRVELVTARGCHSATPAWSGPVHAVPVYEAAGENPPQSVQLDMKLNGRSVETTLDTGASRTLVTRAAAHRAGVTNAMLEQDPYSTGYGMTRDPMKIYRHRFQTLQIGDMTFHDVVLSVGGDIPGAEALLGADLMRHYRLWIPRFGNRVYFQHDKDIPADGTDQAGGVTPPALKVGLKVSWVWPACCG
ncbi:retroviral-like aspartic protease family protein [Gluconobacter morbifer]|uniref:Peptidase A2 domain-containing protein n=1 Tax=Gluconobacter morbifer G707 TaxID=1088869 RepID=G6XFK1_9PROT|nr:retroviral-like aspartic protease family protein [Gluconobacter morbifer]EHH68959.1 hypothetical protein GMO_02660 [Gluconobacter morbifer G707]